MFVHNINPVFLTLGPLEIRWYGLFFVLGFILAYFIIKHLSKIGMVKLSGYDLEDSIFYAGVGGIVGARLFYVLVYNLQFYLANPFEIFAVWQGGLSFHGSLIGGILGLYLFSKTRKFDFKKILDIFSIPLVLGLAIGRIGNFINGELFGSKTNVPWCVDFGDGCRHPSQIYESIYSFFIFGVLWVLKNKKLKNGMLAVSFVLLYSALRFFTGFYRLPDPQIGYILGLTLGQILNIIMFGIGVWAYNKLK